MTKDENKILNIMFLFSDWKTDPRKHLYKELFVKSNNFAEYLVIQHPVGLIIHFFIKFKEKIWGLIRGRFRTKKIMDNVLLFTPVVLTHYVLMLKGNWLIFKIDMLLFSLQIRRILKKKFQDHTIILWLNNPLLIFLLSKIEYNYLVYDYQDNFGFDYDGKVAQPASTYNEKILSKSDLVICTSKVIYDRAIKINSSSILVNNGNDYDTLTKPVPSGYSNEISNFKNPIIGYLGGIRNWIDFELLEFLIKKLDNVHFVFISLIYRNARKEFFKLLHNKNVTWIKYKNQDELSAYLKRFSVGIIPFRINEFMRGVFPNKFFEYMACGVPVVTTPLPELEKFSKVIGFSLTNEEFLQNCLDAIDGKFTDKIKDYAKLAKENSWSIKAEEINAYIKSFLKI